MQRSVDANYGRPRRPRRPRLGSQLINNYVKTILIQKYVKKGDTVLDLCCGSGGDLTKYIHVGIRTWAGYDMVAGCVHRAKMRVESIRPNFAVTLHVTDLREKDVVAGAYSAASCQFAIHYFFGCETHLINFLTNVCVRPNGYFIVTTVDAAVLKKHVLADKKQYPKSIRIGHASVQLVSPPDWEAPFGVAYTFAHPDAVDGVTEYVVRPDVLMRYAQSVGLTCVFQGNFLDVHREGGHSDLRQKFFRRAKMCKEDYETSGLYCTYVFRAKSPTDP